MTTTQTASIDLDLLGRRLRNLTTVIEVLDENGPDLPFAPSISSFSHTDRIDVNFMRSDGASDRDQVADAKRIMGILGGEWTKTEFKSDVYLAHHYGKTRYCIFLDQDKANCQACGETPEVCDCNDHDSNPTDADLAPSATVPVAAQHHNSRQLDEALKAGGI